jgi:hypothetical protein
MSKSSELIFTMYSTSIKEIFTSFVESLKYCPEDPMPEDNATYQSLRSEFSAYDDGNKWFDALCRESATMAEVGISFRNIAL